MMKPLGVTSDYLVKLARNCLEKQPEILPCDIFKSESVLVANKGFIINSQMSNLPGSHFLCVLIKEEEIIYFDSLAFPILNAYIITKLKTENTNPRKPIRYCDQAIQGANSVFCGLYCLSFLIVCQRRRKTFKEFLNMFSYEAPGCYISNEKVCASIIESSLTLS